MAPESPARRTVGPLEPETGTPGRLYYGLHLRHVTPAAGIEALNRGFAVSHRDSLLDAPETPITSASGATSGDAVRVTVTVVAPAHVEETDFPEVFGRSDSGRFTILGGE